MTSRCNGCSNPCCRGKTQEETIECYYRLIKDLRKQIRSNDLYTMNSLDELTPKIEKLYCLVLNLKSEIAKSS